jgi:hypothetical protein
MAVCIEFCKYTPLYIEKLFILRTEESQPSTLHNCLGMSASSYSVLTPQLIVYVTQQLIRMNMSAIMQKSSMCRYPATALSK